MSDSPRYFNDCDALVDAILQQLGNRVVLGLPLGLGKANHLINALYRRACADPGISLSILTALTLERPHAGSELEKRFLDPISARLFDDYPALEYARAVRSGELPDNIVVKDFFLQSGQWLGFPLAQQNHASINYTHALNELLDSGVNLILQLIAPQHSDYSGPEPRFSLGCNPDISADLLDRRRQDSLPILSVAQVNSRLPFMAGAADRPDSDFDMILQEPGYEFELFMPPNKPTSATDHAIGLEVANLIEDGGSLQIGIGSIGDAITHSLVLRHQQNALYKDLLDRLGSQRPTRSAAQCEPFTQGLYGVTEMLVEGFLEMITTGIMTREVDGAVVHAGFFVGSPTFYQRLADMPAATRNKIAMMPVSFTNDLYGDEQRKRKARTAARFVNSAMMVTLGGAVISDGLADYQVVSGVGGQYNFIAQAFALEDGRSIITLPSTRTRKGIRQSNIVWDYAHITIPRHLRDIVVTEYGAADLRGKTDAEVINALLAITDSAFQPQLLEQAKKAGKVSADYEIAPAHRNNTPERIHQALQPARDTGQLPDFPLGSGLTREEEHLAVALSRLSSLAGNKRALLPIIAAGLKRRPGPTTLACLERMQLAQPRGFAERLYRALLLGTLETQRA
ncbi:acetyl-CoA hydrolase/transferase C-terminal domain-containing protein [Halopseudomonas salegens]|uniref:Acyl-CoA hydrolase n=1 Tax=Halopseudomonas salegens TaxID=1434072 RepID=A0A1H2GJB9_9GAMM|nr:acetyl-CoA hydrolase/transferase C-terminal domain-containing protein [Halopseudomonas salegens]SDU19717.1 Acyl-CoA hydrolase [Halopseudomonas salegens]